MKDPLSNTHPELAVQWHPTKNDELTPDDVVAGSHKKVWWKCLNGSDHEWDALIKKRAKRGDGCPFCSGRRTSVTNSLASLYPEIAKQWHFTKNATLTPDKVTGGSNKKVWWKCPQASDHEWEARIIHRVNGVGCPCCSGHKPSITNSLASLYPEIAQEWHLIKNSDLTPEQVTAGSGKKVWWKCSNSFDHEWETCIRDRVNGSKCPYCNSHKVSVTNSLASLYPEIAAQWHPTNNGDLTPDQVTAYSNKKVWWKCPKNSDHEWDAVISSRAKGKGCAFCRGLRPSITNSLAILYPEIAVQWHPTKNGTLTPDQVVAGSHKKIWWKCPKGCDHEWDAVVKSRTKGSRGCPFCDHQKLSVTNSLAVLYPEIAKEWHPIKNSTLTPNQVIAGTATKAWWRCSIDPFHEWEALISNRTQHGIGCPACNSGWTVQNIRRFVSSLINHFETFTPAELYLLFQQSGLLQTQGKSKGFVKALTTGRFPKEELEKFVDGEPSVVDNFLEDKQLTLETLETNSNQNIPDRDTTSSDEIDASVEALEEQEDLNLPLVQTREVLASLNHHVVSSADGEAVEFLIASAKAKIWKHTFIDETAALAQAKAYTGDSYAERVKSEFLDEYHRAKNLPIPSGYNFYAPPNLMQRLAAVQLQDKKRVGNWSGTGAGKTLSAILASRVINAYLTVICCPNSVVDGWEKAIINIFPDSKVAKKTFTPDWTKPNSPVFSVNRDFKEKVNRYLILNYEMFQQPDSANRVRSLLQIEQIDFIVIDEIHYTKQRQVDDMSQRKQLIQALITTVNERNPDLHIIGMSATPVINNLQEGKSLVELVTGVAHDEFDIRPTLPNCMRLHQRLVTLGIRWMPQYKMGYEQIEIPVDCGEFLDDIRALGGNGSH